MPTNRFQFSDDFVLNNGNVGINSATPQTKLDVVGVVRGDNLKVTGVSTFTTYEGFLNSNQNIVENTTISGGGRSGSLSGEIIVGTGITVTVASGTTSSQGNIDSLKVYNTFTVPVGGTADRPPKPTPGQLFFNRDFATMEFWDGDRWRQVDNTTQRGRGVFGGGQASPGVDSRVIEYVNISSLGNSINFGDLTIAGYGGAGMSNSTRGVFGGRWSNPANNVDMYYITLASEGNAIDFGADVTGGWGSQGTSSSTRGLAAGGGYPTGTNVIDSILFSTTGVKYDFGDLAGHGATNNYRGRGSTGCNSPTRSVFFGGYNPARTSVIESKLTASDGNTVYFGDLISKLRIVSGGSNSTRGFIGGGENESAINTIQYITISTFGSATYFGDLSQSRRGVSAVSTQTRGVFAGGETYTNTIEYITIVSTGNSVDFGDLSQSKQQINSVSDSHGGLGGF